jgi:UDP-N-acetyl-2-amino-2-deoxyglucuronate dehydrogenase
LSSESGKLGFGIIGCGWVADAHAWGVKALENEDVELVAVADRDLGKANELGDRFGVDVRLADYIELLDRDDIDAVSVCLPDFLHAEAVIAAAERGKHILCEKPLSLDLASADEMLAACEKAGVNLGIVFNHRYFPDNIRTRAAIDQGALGQLLIGDVIHSSSLTGDPDNSSPWRGKKGRSTGGVLATQAIHFLDLLLWFLGPAESVQAFGTTLVRGEEQDHEDTFAMTLRLASGALATLVTTNGAPITDDFTGTRIEVQGTSGYVALSGDEITTWGVPEDSRPAEAKLPAPPQGSEEVVFGAGHVHEVIDFVGAIRRGKPAPIPGEDGRHLMAVLEAAYKSASDGGEVKVEARSAYSRDQVDPDSLLVVGKTA